MVPRKALYIIFQSILLIMVPLCFIDFDMMLSSGYIKTIDSHQYMFCVEVLPNNLGRVSHVYGITSKQILREEALSKQTQNLSYYIIINRSGYHRLTRDIVCINKTIGIYVNASNVVIDGAGHTVLGGSKSSLYGIYIDCQTNITIKNTTIMGWRRYGLYVLGSLLCDIHSCIITKNSAGIGLNISSHCYIGGNTITNNSHGVTIFSSENVTIMNNILLNYGRNIYLARSDMSIIDNNTITRGCYGVYLVDTNTTYIHGNTIRNSNGGIWLSNTHRIEIIENNIVDSENWSGVHIAGNSSSILVARNTLQNNSHGVGIFKSRNISIHGNFIQMNRDCGIYIFRSVYVHIYANTIRKNMVTGLNIQKSSNVIAYLNNFTDNKYSLGLYDSQVRLYSMDSLEYTYRGRARKGYIGNYWSDYIMFDIDFDGVGELPYGADKYPVVGEIVVKNGRVIIGRAKFPMLLLFFLSPIFISITLPLVWRGINIYTPQRSPFATISEEKYRSLIRSCYRRSMMFPALNTSLLLILVLYIASIGEIPPFYSLLLAVYLLGAIGVLIGFAGFYRDFQHHISTCVIICSKFVEGLSMDIFLGCSMGFLMSVFPIALMRFISLSFIRSIIVMVIATISVFALGYINVHLIVHPLRELDRAEVIPNLKNGELARLIMDIERNLNPLVFGAKYCRDYLFTLNNHEYTIMLLSNYNTKIGETYRQLKNRVKNAIESLEKNKLSDIEKEKINLEITKDSITIINEIIRLLEHQVGGNICVIKTEKIEQLAEKI